MECQRARRLEKKDGHISHNCTYLLEIYIAHHSPQPGRGVLSLTQNFSISGMRDLLSTVFARFGSFLKKSVMDSPSSSVLPAKRPRDHTPAPCPAPANSKRFRDATVLAPMVRSGNCELLLSTSPEDLGFQNSTPSLDASSSVLQANSVSTPT